MGRTAFSAGRSQSRPGIAQSGEHDQSPTRRPLPPGRHGPRAPLIPSGSHTAPSAAGAKGEPTRQGTPGPSPPLLIFQARGLLNGHRNRRNDRHPHPLAEHHGLLIP